MSTVVHPDAAPVLPILRARSSQGTEGGACKALAPCHDAGWGRRT